MNETKPRISVTKFCLGNMSLPVWKQLIQELSDDGACDLADVLMYLNNDVRAGISFRGSDMIEPVKALVSEELELRQKAIFLVMMPLDRKDRIEA